MSEWEKTGESEREAESEAALFHVFGEIKEKKERKEMQPRTWRTAQKHPLTPLRRLTG